MGRHKNKCQPVTVVVGAVVVTDIYRCDVSGCRVYRGSGVVMSAKVNMRVSPLLRVIGGTGSRGVGFWVRNRGHERTGGERVLQVGIKLVENFC